MYNIKQEDCVTDQTRLLYNIFKLLERLVALQERADAPQIATAATAQPVPETTPAATPAPTGTARARGRKPGTKTNSKG